MNPEKEVIALEEALFEKKVRSSRERLLELLSPDFREIGASGNYFGLDEVLRDLSTEEGWSIKTKDYEFRQLSNDIALLTYRACIRHSETDSGVFSIRTSTWKQFEGRWKMAFHQATRIPPFEIASD